MRTLALVVFAGFVSGCAGVMQSPVAPDLPTSYAVSVSADQAWSHILDQLVGRDLLIQHSDRTGGLIRTEWYEIRDHELANAVMECGKAWGRPLRAQGELGGWMRFQVFVRESSDSRTVVRIQPEYQLWPGITGPEKPMGNTAYECVSTGLFERETIQALTVVS